jgi:MoxR-like ATPase
MDSESRLADAAGGPGSGHSAPADVQAGLLGRDDELERLTAAMSGDRRLAVVGEAGIGKTSLIRAALQASGRAARHGGAFATLAWMPYLALRRALGPSIDGDAAQAATLVERQLGPDLLVLDDLHWADPATLATLGYLAGLSSAMGKLGVTRRTELAARELV